MRVALLMGGRSGEHEVSLESGAAIRGALDALEHDCWPLTFRRDGGASWPGGEGTFAQALAALEQAGVDAALLAMHGSDGEDGRIQAALELVGVPYQGSRVAASAVALDKARTKGVYRLAELPVAHDVTLWRRDAASVDWTDVARGVGLPAVLKTAESGSSVGIEVVESQVDLAERGAALLASTESLVVETWLPGREFTVAVLEDVDGTPRALPPVEIRPKTARFFDYKAKYTPGETDEICPAPIDEALTTTLCELGLRAHQVLGCRHYSRTDFKLDATGAPRLLETNTLPGMTPVSLLPKAAAAAGLDFPALVERLLALAVRDGG